MKHNPDPHTTLTILVSNKVNIGTFYVNGKIMTTPYITFAVLLQYIYYVWTWVKSTFLYPKW